MCPAVPPVYTSEKDVVSYWREIGKRPYMKIPGTAYMRFLPLLKGLERILVLAGFLAILAGNARADLRVQWVKKLLEEE